MTEISTLGEFALIKRLTEKITIRNGSTIRGTGDDAAVLRYADKETLVTTDLLLEGIHFDLTYVPMKHLGYKSAVVNFSDVYAMNGQPRQITVSLGVSKRLSVEALEDFYEGLRLACEIYGVDIVGGDTSASLTGLCISITCIGEAEKGRIVYRDAASNTDLICVSGDLGAAYMGLQLLEREKTVFRGEKDFEPDFAGKEYLLERQLKPEARRDIIKSLHESDILPTSMIDISDGLSSELLHICHASGVGCRIYEDRLPIDYQTAFMAEQFNMSLTTAALNGGEDYELLFTVPVALHDRIEAQGGVKIIGFICEASSGAGLIARDGTEIPLVAQGWTSLTES
ncbi:MAG: thiamine-phosphate kinase [Dysgonamonadaceae bacterium]|jgi:thiamine-monophosphate kinase|nr:thiamine-phosphate kinase [Dysgonamonadaceae bacterium]